MNGGMVELRNVSVVAKDRTGIDLRPGII